MSTEPNELEIAYEFLAGIGGTAATALKVVGWFVAALVVPVATAITFAFFTFHAPEMASAPQAQRGFAVVISAVVGFFVGVFVEHHVYEWFKSRWRRAKHRARRKKNG